jgi:hypothetical protein
VPPGGTTLATVAERWNASGATNRPLDAIATIPQADR